MAAFSVTGSLLVPLRFASPRTFALGETSFFAKAEHHLTIFGSTRGRLYRAVVAVDPTLGARADALAASFAFDVAIGDRWLRLAEEADGEVLETLVVLASAPIAGFFEALRSLVSANTPAGVELAASLAEPPPPHVTIFTTDPKGRRGIGLASEAELEGALRAGTGATLRARALTAMEKPNGVRYFPK